MALPPAEIEEPGAAAESARAARPDSGDSIKQTIILVLTAFVLAFVFRAYVVEPFVIPTGSMAPTLIGAHVRFRSPVSGFTWDVTPRDYKRHNSDEPSPIQGATGAGRRPLRVMDPMTGVEIERDRAPVQAGDRILVQKYIYALHPPKRWDIVVFRSPEEPTESFIKRLVGLPGEEVRIADGDVFVRGPGGAEGASGEAWRIARKPLRVQKRLWTTLFSSEWTPPVAQREAIGHDWRGPWTGAGWRTDAAVYELEQAGDGGAIPSLDWDSSTYDGETGQPVWPIDDWAPYNDTPQMRMDRWRFPVADLRLRAGIEAQSADAEVVARIEARGHVFEGFIGPAGAGVRMRPADTPDEAGGDGAGGAGAWTIFETAAGSPRLAPGQVVTFEFWHFDQTLRLEINGALVAEAHYDWTAEARLNLASGRPSDEAVNWDTTDPTGFRPPRVRWTFTGGPVRLHRVGLDRDLAHQPSRERGFTLLGADEFFVLGDNSAASSDSRQWTTIDPWVERQIRPQVGVVPRDLLMGKAFFVYFPAPHTDGGLLPMPDFGRTRFVR